MAEAAIKSLSNGQLADSKGTIYTTPAATQTIAKSISLVNTHSSALTVNIYFKASGGTSRLIVPKDTSLVARAKMECLDKDLMLEAADIIEGSGGTADKIDFVISGIENS